MNYLTIFIVIIFQSNLLQWKPHEQQLTKEDDPSDGEGSMWPFKIKLYSHEKENQRHYLNLKNLISPLSDTICRSLNAIYKRSEAII